MERVCEDSASSEISVIEIASAMNEIAYILEEFRDAPDDSSPFQDNDANLHDGPNDQMSNMPASLSELKDLTSKNFRIRKKFYLLFFTKNRIG